MSSNSKKAPTVKVGGDFKIGNISGQVAIGENIVQVQYNDCVFVLPDGSTIRGKSWHYTQGIRPSTDYSRIFGRIKELEEIDELLRNNSTITITGLRGIGKSTLASMYVDKLQREQHLIGIYWRKMDETIDITDIVASFFEVVGKSINPEMYKIEDQLSLLFRELNSGNYLLVLDNFEILVDPETGKPMKAGFSDLIERSVDICGKSRVIFTSWECPVSNRGIRPSSYHIGGLDTESALNLLKKRSLSGCEADLKKAIELAGGHPLALILLSQLLENGPKALSEIIVDDSLWAGEKGQIAENILDRVYETRLDFSEQMLLKIASIFREPILLGAIKSVASDYLDKDIIERITYNLVRKSLLIKNGDRYWEPSLIRNYVYQKVVDITKYHKKVCSYYCGYFLSISKSKEQNIEIKNMDEARILIEAQHHALLATEYPTAAWLAFGLKESLCKWGEYRAIIRTFSPLVHRNSLIEKQILEDAEHQEALIILGEACLGLYQIDKAIDVLNEGLTFARERGNKEAMISCLSDLGSAYDIIAENKIQEDEKKENKQRATECFIQALTICRETGNTQSESRLLSCLASEQPIPPNEIENMAQKISGPKQSQEPDSDDASKLSKADQLANLAITLDKSGDTKKALEYLSQALNICNDIGNQVGVAMSLGEMGRIYCKLKDTKKAISCFEEALEIAQRNGEMV